MWPRQKGHSGAARPRAHSWYAHARQSAWPQVPTATWGTCITQNGKAALVNFSFQSP